MKYKLKQLVYVKQALHTGEDLFILVRIISVCSDPNYIYVQTLAGQYIIESTTDIATPDYDCKEKKTTRKVPVSLLFTKEEVELLYGA